jgi:hypothetical protein
MNKSERRKKFEEQDWHLMFDILEKNPDITREYAYLKFQKNWARSTIGRALNVSRFLFTLKDGYLSHEEVFKIADNAGYSAKNPFVQKAFGCYLTWKLKKGKDDSNIKTSYAVRKHYDDLFATLEKLRLCTEYIGSDSGADRTLLIFRDNDWRIDPVQWFYLSTPDLESQDWQPILQQLKLHTPDWKFWKHWEHLKTKVIQESEKIQKACNEISKTNDEFMRVWQDIRLMLSINNYELGKWFRPSRTCLKPEPDTDFLEQLADDDTIEYIINEIEKAVPEPLWEDFIQLEMDLEKIKKDLAEPMLFDWILKLSCGACANIKLLRNMNTMLES